MNSDIAERVLDGLDGLVITGGKDVDPAAYGQAPHPATDEPGHQRDAWEFTLLGAALKRELPVLGICRGAQVLNVVLGGTLHQHLPDVIGHTGHQAGNAVFTTLPVRTTPGTRLAALVGESIDAQCCHHQAIAELGDGLIASAFDADGVVEALELPADGFVLCAHAPDPFIGCDSTIYCVILDAWASRRPWIRPSPNGSARYCAPTACVGWRPG